MWYSFTRQPSVIFRCRKLYKALYFAALICYNIPMSLKEFWETYKRCRRQKRSGLSFPILTKLHGVKSKDRQGALIQSERGDKLQFVQVALPDYPYNAYVYSIPLNRVLGYLDKELAEKLVYVFGEDFCLDGAIDKIIGGPPMKYRGALIHVFDNNVFMENEDISSLKEE